MYLKSSLIQKIIGFIKIVYLVISRFICLFGFYGISKFVSYCNAKSIFIQKTVLFQTIQFSGPGTNGNEGVLHIPQSSSITEASPSDSLMLYQDTHWGILPLCRDAVSIFCSPSQLGYRTLIGGILPLCRHAVSIFCSPSILG